MVAQLLVRGAERRSLASHKLAFVFVWALVFELPLETAAWGVGFLLFLLKPLSVLCTYT